jgi:hypothetical protein
MLAHGQGTLLNASCLASALQITVPTVQRYIDLLADLLLVKRLPQSAFRVPYSFLGGMECHNTSGAQHRARIVENPRIGMISLRAILRFTAGAFTHARAMFHMRLRTANICGGWVGKGAGAGRRSNMMW